MLNVGVTAYIFFPICSLGIGRVILNFFKFQKLFFSK